MLDSSLEDDSFNLSHSCRDDVTSTCQQWVDLQVLRVVELKQRKRVDHSKHIIKTMDEVLSPILLKLKADKILLEVLQYEKERIEMSVNLYKSFYLSLQNQYDRMKENIDKMQNNLQDYEQFCQIPLEQRNELLERLASIVLSDNKGVVNAVQNLVESTRREHETMFDHYDQEKNTLLKSGKNIEESSNMVTCRSSRNEEVSTEIVDSIQQGIDQLDIGIEEVSNGIREVIYNIANQETES
ncbi:uncharacterized protein LOC128997162 [Macrosteles quadrilineatus]|uniref:uncharacterized protein LOC128997162 n=1 Tax=Macrosteles quadrilineatus TaxID=74068 RepID=UPI0023E2EFD9|nr:uncharacterized protein LOC128997162 [Macrosteles quadrilineatus]